VVGVDEAWCSGEVANSTVKRKQAVRLGEGAVKKM
jgi:hypothetical protein